MDRSEFLRIVKRQFPDLREPINKEQGLLHFEVSGNRYDWAWDLFPEKLKALFRAFHAGWSDALRGLSQPDPRLQQTPMREAP